VRSKKVFHIFLVFVGFRPYGNGGAVIALKVPLMQLEHFTCQLLTFKMVNKIK